MKNINLENYEDSLNSVKKKKNGIFYTDESLANYMVDAINITYTDKIIDPSCGTGIFLRCLKKKFKDKFNIHNIYGIDCDKNAIKLLKEYFYVYYDKKVVDKNIIYGDSINKKQKILDFKDNSEKFDYVIGNPPYVSGKESENYNPNAFNYKKYISANVNLAMLMLIRSLDIIKNDGVISFILPKNILFVDSYKKIRNDIVHNYTINEIVDLGLYFKNVRGEQIILTITNKKPEYGHRVKIKKLISKKNLKMETTEVFQHIYLAKDSIILYNGDKESDLMNKIGQQGQKLSKCVIDIFRGIPVNDDMNKKIAYRGRDIKKFGVKGYIMATPKDREKYSEKIKLLNNKKLIIQNIFSTESGIIASYMDENSITTETVTNIIDSDEKKLKYILGLISSKLLNYYLIINIYNNSKLTMHTDKKYIGKLPIVISSIYYTQIINLVNDALNENYNTITDITNKIDKLVYQIYGLNKKEIEFIENRMKKILSKEWF